MNGVTARRMQASYLQVGEGYELLGAGFIELNETPTATTSAKRYINQKTATSRVIGYEWSTAFNADQIKSEKAIQEIVKVGKLQLLGSECEYNYAIVDLDESVGAESNKFKARQIKVGVAVESFADNEGDLSVVGKFVAVGDMVDGIFDTTTKTFTAK